MESPIVTISGLRGLVGSTFERPALRYIRAFLEVLGSSVQESNVQGSNVLENTILGSESHRGRIIVSLDGRESGFDLLPQIGNAIVEAGYEPLLVNVQPTPTAGWLVRKCKAVGGIQLTASHNPSQFNGVKLFDSCGRVIAGEIGQKVLELYGANTRLMEQEESENNKTAAGSELNEHVSTDSVPTDSVPTDSHPSLTAEQFAQLQPIESILATVDAEAIRRKNYRVLVDSNNGSGFGMALRLLETGLNCQVIGRGTEMNGQFLHTPEPIAENLIDVCREFKYGLGSIERIDVGFCQDPDADRLALIDETGRYIGEEYTVALCVRQILKTHRGPVVINCATSRMTEDLCRAAGVECFRSPVGEANVADAMIAHGAVYGGEGNGGPIDPRVGYVRDSFVGMAAVLALMAEENKPLSVLADELPQYHIVKNKCSFPTEKLSELYSHVLETLVSSGDSSSIERIVNDLRIDWPDGWLLIHPSNTEPVIRVIAEFTQITKSAELCREVENIVEKVK